MPPKSEVPERSVQDDDEYRRNYVAFEHVNALYALDNGWTGKGVLVGVVDDGVVANTELAGQISPLSRDFGNVTTGGVTKARNVIGDSYSDHGTMVAGVIAARNDGSGVQGMAPDAQIVALRISDTNTTTGEETLGRTLPAALDYAASNGIKIVNASLAKIDASKPSQGWSDMVARYTASGGLFVNSAGNDGEANAKGYLDLTAANRDGWLFVTALEETDGSLSIADYANRCGSAAMSRCVSAMGTNGTMDVAGELVAFSGTSAAAGQVSGLAALILGKWPQLSGVQVGQVILNTAKDIGDAGVDPTYGVGLIDVRAALAPVSPTLSNGLTQTAAAGAAMVIPAAVGGAQTGAQLKAMLAHVTVLDAFGRDYSGSLAGLVANPEQRAGQFARRVASSAMAGNSQFGAHGFAASFGYTTYRTGPNPTDQRGQLTYAGLSAKLGSANFVASFSGQDAVQDEAMGLAPASDVTLAYAPGANLAIGVERPVGGVRMAVSAVASDGRYGSARGVLLGLNTPLARLKVGYMDESGTLFGTPVGAGAMRFGDGARTAFVELSRKWRLGAWSLNTYASTGATRLKIGGDTLLTWASTILSQRAGLSASRAALAGRIRFGVALPLVAFSGSGELTYANGYDLATRSLLYNRERVGLIGQYQPAMSVGYERIGTNSALRLAAAKDVATQDWRALASYRITLP